MTFDRPMMVPPDWADWLLSMVLASKDRESVSGDLLEEYRQSIVPARGAGADRWYLRQVAWYVLRAIWFWSALIAAICLTRYLFDTLAPVHYTRGVVHPRSAIMSWALMGTFVAAGAWHAWRSGYVSGVVAAVLTAVCGSVLSQAGMLACLAVWHDAEIMRAIEGSGGTGELWAMPVPLVLAGFVTGTAGAMIGKLCFWSAQRLGLKPVG